MKRAQGPAVLPCIGLGDSRPRDVQMLRAGRYSGVSAGAFPERPQWHARSVWPHTTAALAILLATGCSVTPVMPKPSEALLTDCDPPVLIADADSQTAADINEERVEVARYAVCWRGKFYSLRDWLREMAQ